MKIISRGILCLILVGAAGGAFIYSGVYDISATKPHLAPVKWIISRTMDRSVKSHAKGIQAPNQEDSALVAKGFDHFKEMCVECHGAPGVQRSEMAKGLYPKAPGLKHAAEEWSPAELFWITKNGIKMTGMPAFAPTHDDDEIWAIVAFVKKLPSLDSTAYAALDKSAPEAAATPEKTEAHHDRKRK